MGLAVVVLVVQLLAGPAPGDGLGLAPPPPADASGGTTRPSSTRPTRRAPAVPPLPVLPVVPGRRRGGRRGRRGRPNWGDLVVVYVPGHGGRPDGFDGLADRIGLGPGDVVVFDYRSAGGTGSFEEASRTVPVRHAATALDRMVRRLVADGHRVYLVGHSKGGAAVAELIGRWDALGEAPDGVVGAALLDPAIADGVVGMLQRVGGGRAWVPDNGGFDPVTCAGGRCVDVREGLGRRSGVEVVAIRDPDGLVFSFRDRPRDLRVYDVDNDLPVARWFTDPFGRIAAAHSSMLHDARTARCIAAELEEPGSCRWRPPRFRLRPWGRGRGVGPLVR